MDQFDKQQYQWLKGEYDKLLKRQGKLLERSIGDLRRITQLSEENRELKEKLSELSSPVGNSPV